MPSRERSGSGSQMALSDGTDMYYMLLSIKDYRGLIDGGNRRMSSTDTFVERGLSPDFFLAFPLVMRGC
jgi:hypothetical protein